MGLPIYGFIAGHQTKPMAALSRRQVLGDVFGVRLVLCSFRQKPPSAVF